ncbi:nucleotidyltransferase family protein [Bartonella sp. B41]
MIGNIDNFAILATSIEITQIEKEHCSVLSFTATEFFNNPGRRNQEVQSEPIEVKSYGRIVGYYLSPLEYNRLINAVCRASEPGAYNSIKDLVHARRHDILSLAKKYGITRIRLFGSVASGEDQPHSDIDFLVEFPENKPFSEDDFEFIGKLQEMFGKRRVDVVRLEMIDKRLKKSILDGAIEL